ncbi:TPA: methylamine utilization protein MauJ, partial [Legionella pneumophila]
MSQDSFQSSYTPVHYGKSASEFSKERGQWLLANVEQQIGWPQKRALISYRGRKILLLPATSKYYAGVAVITKIGQLDEGKIFVMQFLSALAWYRPSKIDIIQWTNSATQGSLNQYLRLELTKRPGMTALFFRPTMLPDPKNKNAQLALSLFREGLSLNHLGYSFLSYYKIINMRYPNGATQKQWIRSNLYKLESLKYLSDRLSSLKQKHNDLAYYIYTECRCAVAHAGGTAPVYDPESLYDEIRFYEIQPIAHALAKIIIEDEFCIKTTNTILKEHLYELEGFHYLIGDKVTKRLKDRESISTTEIQIPHLISLRLWGKRKFRAFEKLSVTVIGI